MHNIFCIVFIEEEFCVDPATGQFALDANNNHIVDRSIKEMGNLFNIWHNLTKEDIVESSCIYHNHAEDVDRTNLPWSWECLLTNVDTNLCTYIMAEVESVYPT